jgi:hypothetical protein
MDTKAALNEHDLVELERSIVRGVIERTRQEFNVD